MVDKKKIMEDISKQFDEIILDIGRDRAKKKQNNTKK